MKLLTVLADIIQVEDVNELCKLLILASRQAAKAFLDIVFSILILNYYLKCDL
jgi:hypothetical protein